MYLHKKLSSTRARVCGGSCMRCKLSHTVTPCHHQPPHLLHPPLTRQDLPLRRSPHSATVTIHTDRHSMHGHRRRRQQQLPSTTHTHTHATPRQVTPSSRVVFFLKFFKLFFSFHLFCIGVIFLKMLRQPKILKKCARRAR